jgi:hypothetical protein
VFLDHFDADFKKKKKYYFDIFLNKTHFKKQPQLHSNREIVKKNPSLVFVTLFFFYIYIYRKIIPSQSNISRFLFNICF